MSGIVGLVEVCRSMSFKITGDAQPHSGLGKFETKDFFCSLKASCTPDSAEEVSASLFQIAERDVMAAVDYHANITQHPKRTASPSVPPDRIADHAENVSTETQSPQKANGSYVVAEKGKSSESSTPPAKQPSAAESNKLVALSASKIIADRLKSIGLTADELKRAVTSYFHGQTEKFTQAQYVEAFTATEAFIKQHGVDKFREGLANPPAQAQIIPSQEDDVFLTDPAVLEAMNQVGKLWPSWSPSLNKQAGLWLADHAKAATQLQAFLITSGFTDQTPVARIESFLAITRHMSMGHSQVLMDYAKKSQKPLGMIEDELSKAVGADIRWSLEIPRNAVFEALKTMTEATK